MDAPPWLQEPLDRFAAMLERLPHALLVQGPRGWGEERVASALALRLLRLAPELSAAEVAHPDLRWLEAENGSIRIDAVRGITEFLTQTPQFAGRKVAVIRDAERMNPNAANALLKRLEEPPAESFIALTSGAAERILPTVRSRCQRIDVAAGTPQQALDWLQESGVEAEPASFLAVEYGGAPFSVLAAVQRGQEPLWPLLAQAGRDVAAVYDLAEQRRNEDFADLLSRWWRIVHWLMRHRLANQEHLLDFATELSKIRQAALLNTGLNRTVQLQRLLLMWCEIWPRLPPDAVPRLLLDPAPEKAMRQH